MNDMRDGPGSRRFETDYLVVGAGAGGMAFTDALLTHTDATITIVDRRRAPGGHWIDAYPYVRLHQPSAFYGVDSVPLGQDFVDVAGTNAGYYELAGADEIRAYYTHVMQRRFLPSGRVRYFPNCVYRGEHRFDSLLSGASWQVSVRRKLIDTTYVEGTIPATSPPPFELAEGVRCVPAGGIAHLTGGADRFVIIGGGKTAADAGVWLLEQGVPPAAIRWIRPREPWWLNRRFFQPRRLLPDFYRGAAIQFEAMAEATSVEDLCARLESGGLLLRIARDVTPTMLRGAILSEAELTLLRQIEDVVRMGRVRRIERHEIVMERGSVPTSDATVHIHCAAAGLARPPLRPIFEPGRVTVQPFQWGFVSYQFAALGVMEAVLGSDEEKNLLCPPIHYWNENNDYPTAFLAALAHGRAIENHPVLARWARETRLNPLAGIDLHRDAPGVAETRQRIRESAPAATANLARLTTDR